MNNSSLIFFIVIAPLVTSYEFPAGICTEQERKKTLKETSALYMRIQRKCCSYSYVNKSSLKIPFHPSKHHSPHTWLFQLLFTLNALHKTESLSYYMQYVVYIHDILNNYNI